MTSNIVQNYIIDKNHGQNKKPVGSVVRSTGVKPGPTRGYLVKENLLESAVSNVKTYGDNFKYLYNAAIKGEGKDYSVGRINDLTLRLGSLAIAGVLSASKMFPVAKGMEFIGLGTWFMGMAVWPKIMGAPIKKFKGVDINQKYSNFEGDRKNFFLDSQYLPWDLYSDDEINKIGDKLKVPKNIKNRRDAIQNKMKQIAIQGNTLWMLTAGFATPLIASLASDQIQKRLLTPNLEKKRIKSAGVEMENADKKIVSILNQLDDYQDAVDKKILFHQEEKNHRLSPINEKLRNSLNNDKNAFKKLSNLIDNKGDKLSAKQLKDLNEFFKTRYNGSTIYEGISKYLSGLSSVSREGKEISVISEKAIDEKAFKKDLGAHGIKLENASMKTSINEFEIIDNGLPITPRLAKIDAKAAVLYEKTNKGKVKPSIEIFNEVDEIAKKVIKPIIEKNSFYNINPKEIKVLFEFAEGFVNLTKPIENYRTATIKNISDSMTANQWGKIPISYLKAMEFSNEQIQDLASNKLGVHEILDKHFSSLSKDKAQKIMEKMAVIAEKAIENEKEAKANMEEPIKNVSTLLQKLAKANGYEGLSESFNYIYDAYNQEINAKIVDTHSSFIRPIKAIDVYSRDIKGEYIEMLKAKKANNKFPNQFYEVEKYLYPDVEAVVDYVENKITKSSKKIELSNAKDNEYAEAVLAKIQAKYSKNKSFNIKAAVKDAIDEKVMDKFAGNVEKYVKNTVLNANDVDTWTNKFEGYFDDIPKNVREKSLLYDIADLVFGKMKNKNNNKTIEKLDGHNQYMKNVMLRINRVEDELLPHMTTGYDNEHAFKRLSVMTGKDVTDFFVKAAQNYSNNRKWWRFTSIVGGTLLAATAIAISQFGKRNHFNPEAYEYKGVNNEGK